MKHLYNTLIAILMMGIGIAHAQITVDATAGTSSAGYSTLKAAFDAINNGTHQGVIDIRVHDNTTETVSASLDSSGNPTLSNYTSVLIRPADTATVVKNINCSVSGIAIVNLNGADNVIIDGRPLSAGSNSLLRINSTATAATSYNIRLINGAQGNTFTYLQSQCTLNPTVTSIIHVLFALGTSTTPTANNTFQYSRFTGGVQGFQFTGSATITSANNLLYKNIIEDFKTLGILLSNGIVSLTIDSNIIRHNSTFNSTETTGLYGMDVNFVINNSTINFTRNTILDLSLGAAISTTGLYGVRIFPQTAGIVNANVNVYNNIISLTRTNSTVSGNQIFQGFRFSGAAPANVKFIHNTVRIGGSTSAAGVVNSIGVFRANSSTATTYIARNNIVVNERITTGGICAASWLSNNAGSVDVDYNTYYTPAGNYTALWYNGANSTIYTTTTAYRTGVLVSPNEQNTEFGLVTFASTSNLSPAGASVNDLSLLGAPLNSLVLSDITGTSRFVPTYKGAVQLTPFTNRKDASVKEVYTLGKLPIPYAIPHEIRANIINKGIDTLFSQQVNLQVSGANTYSDAQVIDTIAPGAAKIVTFNSFSYSTTGNCVVTVTVPNDSTNSNNSKSFNQIITNDIYAYAEPTLPSLGGVGFNGSSGEFVAKFPYTGANAINQVGINFNTGGQPYQIVIYEILNDTPGALLWSSASLTSVAGINTIPVFPTVSIFGTFFVGVKQTGTVNVAFGYQSEDPIRDKVFYYKNLTIGLPKWNDFAVAGSPFRFMVEPRLQVANDMGVENVESPCLSVVQGSAPINPKVRVFNYGLNTRTSVVVSYQITGPVSSSGSDSLSLGTLFSGQSATLTLSSTFNPTIAGTYTMKIWTRIPGTTDGAKDNDTASITFTVSNINTYANAGNHITLNGTNQSASVNGSGALNISGSMLTLESWVYFNSLAGNRHIFAKNENATSSQYNLYINSLGQVVFKLNTSATDSVVSTSTVGLLAYSHIAATYDGTLGDARIYINGMLAGSKFISGPIASSTGNLYIGRGFAGGTTYFGGSLDEVRIWDTARTESQIRAGMHTRLGNAPHVNLKGYWRMDTLINNLIADAAGNCGAALLENAPTISTSPLPLGAPTVSSTTIVSSGVTNIASSSVSFDIYNQVGTNDIVIHRFTNLPHGTLPTTTPGGVTNTNINNWVMYRYGTGQMDSVDVTFSITGISAGANAADIKLFSRPAGSDAGWSQLSTATAVNPTNQTVTLRMVTPNFGSQITIGANNNPLPVELLYFNAKNNKMDVDLAWATASETDNAGFHIERSVNGKDFEEIGYVKGQGNSNEQVRYTLRDEKAFALTGVQTLYYRIVQKDFSGKTETSQTVSISVDDMDEPAIAVYPNPFTAETNIQIDASSSSDIRISITDITGKEVSAMNTTLQKGINILPTDGLSSLSKGLYMIRIVTAGGEVTTHKLVKQ